MIEQWLKKDIEKCFAHNATRIVITDSKREGAFMRSLIPSEYPVIDADGDQAEADAKYKAEHEFAGTPLIIYTHTPKHKLGLLLDYAKTGGCIVLDDMEAYIKDHIFYDLRLNVEMPRKQLILAAKLSKGKDKKWWTGICDGSIPPMDIHREVLNLLLNPQEVYERMDADTWELFQEEVFILLQKPKSPQSPISFAQEIFNSIFTGLTCNKLSKELLSIYYDLIENDLYSQSVHRALNSFNTSSVNVLKLHPNHCFEDLDRQFMRELSTAMKEGKPIFNYQHLLNERLSTNHARHYRAPWLADLKTLLDFHEPSDIPEELDLVANYYQNNFTQLDSAMRHLYTEWLNEESVLRPLQEKYESFNKIIQESWNANFKSYATTQRNMVPNFFKKPGRSAAIVCDGLRLEMAIEVVRQIRSLSRQTNIEQRTAYAVLPSITENGMSALYGSIDVLPTAQKRFELLHSIVPDSEVKSLDMLSPSETAEHLVLTFGDIDQVCEKKQLAGLKDISHYIDYLRDAIIELLRLGYTRVLLTSDHGFVITGILDDADKIAKPDIPDVKVEERYALTSEVFNTRKYHVLTKSYGGYNYQIYPKSDKPFVTRGAYGYAHGGYTPQECIIPAFEFTEPEAAPALKVRIMDKSQLSNVVGAYFKIRIKAEGNAGSLFEQERKICITLYDGNGNASMPVIKTIKAGQVEEMETTFPGGKCNLIVTDADTKVQLDNCEVSQSNQRDLSDL